MAQSDRKRKRNDSRGGEEGETFNRTGMKKGVKKKEKKKEEKERKKEMPVGEFRPRRRQRIIGSGEGRRECRIRAMRTILAEGSTGSLMDSPISAGTSTPVCPVRYRMNTRKHARAHTASREITVRRWVDP